MRIGIDATLFQNSRYTGVENYARSIIHELLRIDHENRYVLFFRKEIPPELNILRPNVRCIVSPTPNRILTDQIWMPFATRLARIDLLHCPAFPAPVFVPCRTVLTIHDAVIWKYPETISKGARFYYRPLFPQAIRRARRIIAVSHSTKADLVRLFPCASGKTKVIYEAAVTPASTEDDLRSSGLLLDTANRKYILTVGSIEPRKNLPMMLKAFQNLRKLVNEEIFLVIVGRMAWSKELRVAEDIKDRVIITGYVDQQELIKIYRHATLFVLPSIYEGFGLPVLEAMAMGVPVLCSKSSSLPEIAGDAAEYANPRDHEDFARKMAYLINNSDMRKEMIRRGTRRAQAFSWEKTAQQTLAVYAEAL